jgi:hypothetical protein
LQIPQRYQLISKHNRNPPRLQQPQGFAHDDSANLDRSLFLNLPAAITLNKLTPPVRQRSAKGTPLQPKPSEAAPQTDEM